MTAFSNPAGTWNQRYSAAEGYLFGTAPNAWLARHANVWPAGQRVLCVADGEGRNSVWLAQQGLRVEAFDIAEVGLTKARRLAAERGVTVDFQLADVDGFAWPKEPRCPEVQREAGAGAAQAGEYSADDRYDGIAAIFVQFADPALRARLFERMQAALKPGGRLILQGYTPKQLEYKTGGPPQVEHLYTETLLRGAFAGMDIEVLDSYEAELDEGSGHRGRSALIGLVARKR